MVLLLKTSFFTSSGAVIALVVQNHVYTLLLAFCLMFLITWHLKNSRDESNERKKL